MNTGGELINLAEQAFNSTERRNAEQSWQDLADYILPNQSGLLSSSLLNTANGQKTTNRLFDSTAVQANQDLASAIHSTLTNPATRWSKMRYRNQEWNERPELTKWLDDVSKAVHEALNTSNFDQQIAKCYQFYPSLGTMALLEEAKPPLPDGSFGGLRFTAIHVAQAAWLENADGTVDTIYRKFEMTFKQIMERWPETAPEFVKKRVEKCPEETTIVYHCVKPRSPDKIKFKRPDVADPENRPFASYYVTETEYKILEEGGFYELPEFVVRWSTLPGEAIGRGPGHIALPDIISLNRARKMYLQAAAKAIDPPIMTTQRNVIGSLNMRPSGVNVVQSLDRITEFKTSARFDVSQFISEEARNMIRTIFLLDKLLLPPRENTGEMTAFEVSQRIEQMQRVLGPTLSRLNNELLEPLVIRTIGILKRAGMLPEIPEAIRGTIDQNGLDVEIQFVNQLARAQQIEEVTAIQQWTQLITQMAQLNPEVLDNVNFDEAAKLTGKTLGVAESVIADKASVEAIREQRNEQAQQERAVALQQQMADAQAKANQ